MGGTLGKLRGTKLYRVCHLRVAGGFLRFLLLWLTLTCITAISLNPVAAAEPPVLELAAGEDGPSLAPYLRYIETSANGALPQLQELPSLSLKKIQGSTIHFGPPGTRTVVFLNLRNAGAQQGSWVLTTGRGSLKNFRLFEVDEQELALLVDGNDPRQARENLGTYQAFSAELVLDPQQEKLIVIEFLSENSTYMPLRVQTYGSFFKDRRANIAMVSAVVIGALTLVLLNFLFFSITGFKEFLWLAVAEAFFALNTVHSEGYITIFFLYDKPLAGVAVEDFIKCGFAGAMAQFGRSFVKTRVYFPRRDLALKSLIGSATAVMLLQSGLALYPAELRFALHLAAWLVTVGVALFLPFVAFAAMRQFGSQLWPLLVGWASLALFIIYAAVASMGVFAWLPINWHLAGPVGLFESIMVTFALGLNIKRIQSDKLAADAKYARSMADQLATSERAKRLAEEKAYALETVNSQNALLHASGHDSSQVIVALHSAVAALKSDSGGRTDRALIDMLQSSADYLSEIVSTTISGANIAAGNVTFVALSSFRAQALVEPLSMMFKAPFAKKNLSLDVEVDPSMMIISDKPLLMRALANLLSNSCKFASEGGAAISISQESGFAIILVSDTGCGMPPDVAKALNHGTALRIRGEGNGAGTGSGFGSARRIVESLKGTIAITSSSALGTEVRLVLPMASRTIDEIKVEELQNQIEDWTVLDFDQRAQFDARLSAPGMGKERALAVTYDDTTVTRGRLSELVSMILIKPLSREMLRHPLLAERSEQI